MVEGEHRFRLPDQNPDEVRQSLKEQPQYTYLISLDQLTEKRDIRTYDLHENMPGRESHSNRNASV